VFVRYPPARIRYAGDQPVTLLGVRIAPSYRLVDLPLGPPTTSARSGRGTWALYALGAEVVVVHPDGAVSGPPADVAAEVGRLAAQERQGELDRQAGMAHSLRLATLLAGSQPSDDRRLRALAGPASTPTPSPQQPPAVADHRGRPGRQDDMKITATCSNCQRAQLPGAEAALHRLDERRAAGERRAA
jgi:hypothetical protein